jgi:hypothetical protein
MNPYDGSELSDPEIVDDPKADFDRNYSNLSIKDFPGADDGEPAFFAQEAGTEPSSELGRFIIDQLMPLEMKEGADSSNAENSSWVIKDTLDRIAKFVDENEGDPDLAAKVEDRFMPFGFKNTSGTSDEDLPPSAWWQRGAVLDAARLINKNSKTGFDQKAAKNIPLSEEQIAAADNAADEFLAPRFGKDMYMRGVDTQSWTEESVTGDAQLSVRYDPETGKWNLEGAYKKLRSSEDNLWAAEVFEEFDTAEEAFIAASNDDDGIFNRMQENAKEERSQGIYELANNQDIRALEGLLADRSYVENKDEIFEQIDRAK